MSDSAEIDNALVAKLLADGTLTGLMPDGVFVDVAAPGATRFVIVSLLEEHDVPQFGGRAYEDALYLVKAVALSTTNGNTRGAAARIDALLEDGTLTIPGYLLMAMFREERVRLVETDDADSTLRWTHRGGHYRVQASLVLPMAPWVDSPWIQAGWVQA